MSETIAVLEQAGIPVAELNADEWAAIAELSEEEVKTLVRIHEKVHAEVKGFVTPAPAFQPLGATGGIRPGVNPPPGATARQKGDTTHTHSEQGAFIF